MMYKVATLVALFISCVLITEAALAASKHQIPAQITVGKDTNGDGWYKCYTRVASLNNQKWSFACPVYPTTVALASSWWTVAKCAAAIVAFVATNAVALSKLRKAGGAWRVAKRIVKAKGWEGKAKVIAAVFGDITGLAGVIDTCGG